MWGALPKTLRLTDKKANEIFLKIRKFRCSNILPDIKRPLVIYDFATDPF